MGNENEFNYTIFSKETIDKQFEQLQNELKTSMNHRTILKKFHKILFNRVIPTAIYNSESDEFTIYRITDTWEGFNPDSPNCYSYNPKPVNIGRANLIGFPVFYGSIDPYTAFSEMKGAINTQKTFYLSRWKIKFKSNTNVHSLVINSSTKNNEHILNQVAKHIHNKLKEMVKNLPIEYKEGYIYAIEKMGDLFTAPGDINYHITSAYTHDILYDGISNGLNIPIILYPSVQDNQNSVNWAIHPSFVESDEMSLQDVFELSLKENSSKEESIEVNVHQKGKFKKGNIIWEIPNFTPFEIDFKEIKIKTYNNQLLEGKTTYNLKINGTKLTIKELIEKNINKHEIQSKLTEISYTKEENSELDFENETFNWLMVLKFEHGNEIKTKEGKSCINFIQVPINWTREYKSVN